MGLTGARLYTEMKSVLSGFKTTSCEQPAAMQPGGGGKSPTNLYIPSALTLAGTPHLIIDKISLGKWALCIQISRVSVFWFFRHLQLCCSLVSPLSPMRVKAH